MTLQQTWRGNSIATSWAEACRRRSVSLSSSDTDGYAQYRGREVEFIHEVLGHDHWEAQTYIVEALLKHRYVAVRSCRKSSKTFTASDIVCTFMSTGPTIAITTASSGRQVKKNLWSKIRAAHSGSLRPLPGKPTTTDWEVRPEWYATGFSTDDSENILGFHASTGPPRDPEDPRRALRDLLQYSDDVRLLWVLDETPGIDQSIIDAAKGSWSGPNVYVLMLGNSALEADEPHEFATAFKEGSGWHRVRISSEPVTEEQLDDDPGADRVFDEVPSWLIPEDWKRKRKQEWGDDSNLWRAHGLGLFFKGGSGGNRVITRAMLQSALDREAQSEQGAHMGVDIARSLDGDKTVCVLWVDGVKKAEASWRVNDGMLNADKIEEQARKWSTLERPLPGQNWHLDGIGLGSGPVDRLRQKGYAVDSVDFGGAVRGHWRHITGEMQFRNCRAECHWVLRRVLQEGLGHIPERFTASWAEAQWATFKEDAQSHTGTKIRIQPKEEIKARYGASPDTHDADLLAWCRGGWMPLPPV